MHPVTLFVNAKGPCTISVAFHILMVLHPLLPSTMIYLCLTSRLKVIDELPMQLGARFVRGNVNLPFALRSGQLITAQNPASAHAFANLIIEGLSQGVRLTP